jgi:hypothetical protein
MIAPRWFLIALAFIVLWPIVRLAVAWHRMQGMSREHARLEVRFWLRRALAIESGKLSLPRRRNRPSA